jgi:uncharacterized protein (DUF2147 family)
MHNNRKLLTVFGAFFIPLALFLSLISHPALAQTVSPVGYWRTIDDVTGQPRSVVQIWQSNGQLQGKLTSINFRSDESPKDLCTKCAPPRNTQQILGMTILWGMTYAGNNTWSNGQILDPKIGKIYSCKLYLSRDGRSMEARGYIGVSLLGRSQQWYRVKSLRG